jgi:hypothetical protein
MDIPKKWTDDYFLGIDLMPHYISLSFLVPAAMSPVMPMLRSFQC